MRGDLSGPDPSGSERAPTPRASRSGSRTRSASHCRSGGRVTRLTSMTSVTSTCSSPKTQSRTDLSLPRVVFREAISLSAACRRVSANVFALSTSLSARSSRSFVYGEKRRCRYCYMYRPRRRYRHRNRYRSKHREIERDRDRDIERYRHATRELRSAPAARQRADGSAATPSPSSTAAAAAPPPLRSSASAPVGT